MEIGKPWFEPLVEKLKTSEILVVLITNKSAYDNLWVNFEIGVSFGANKSPIIFVFGGVGFIEMKYPIRGLQVLDTGDTNRWKIELQKIGCANIDEHEKSFAQLFRQNPPN